MRITSIRHREHNATVFILKRHGITTEILEDRLRSAIEELGMEVPWKMSAKLNLLKKQDPWVANGIFVDDVLSRIQKWSQKDRNPAVHTLGEYDFTDEQLSQMSARGEKLAKEAASAVMRLKKQTKKKSTS